MGTTPKSYLKVMSPPKGFVSPYRHPRCLWGVARSKGLRGVCGPNDWCRAAMGIPGRLRFPAPMRQGRAGAAPGPGEEGPPQRAARRPRVRPRKVPMTYVLESFTRRCARRQGQRPTMLPGRGRAPSPWAKGRAHPSTTAQKPRSIPAQDPRGLYPVTAYLLRGR